MPQIQTYDDHIAPQGGLNVQASPADFGAQIGQATERFGGAVQGVAEEIHQYNTTQDVTNVHVNMAKARAEWTKTYQDRANSAQPGDETFAPTMMKDMADYFQKGAASATTPAGKRLWAQMSASMTSEFGVRAVDTQGDLAAKDAVNKYDTIARSYGAAAFADHTQADVSIASAKAAIDDPNGMFAKIPQTARDKFKQQVEQDIKFAAANGFVEKYPDAMLKSIAPDTLQLFKPGQKLVDTNTAPGAKANIGKATMQWAPDVQRAGAEKGVNPNILLAQIQQESSGNPKAVGPMTKYGTAKGLSQFIDSTAAQYGVDVTNPKSSINGQAAMMSDLLKKYGGDYSKALAAYNWGPGNVDKTLQAYGSLWQNHLPAETSNYVAKIMTNAGAVTTGEPPMDQPINPVEQPAPQQPVQSSLSFMNGLSWEQQNHIVSRGVQLEHLQLSMETRAREMADYAVKKQRETAMSNYISRIVDPDNHGGVPSDVEISNDKILTGQEIQHLADYKLARLNELRAAATPKPNPENVRNLMLQIHAADDDPTKTYNMEPVDAAFRSRLINTDEWMRLRGEVEQMRDGNGNNFGKQVHQTRNLVEQMFMRSYMGQADPAKAIDASYRFNFDLQQKINQYRKDNKDPSVLLDPGSREYMLKGERLNSYGMAVSFDAGTQANVQASQSLASQAQKAKAVLPTYQQYDTLKKGDQYTDPQGNVRTKG